MNLGWFSFTRRAKGQGHDHFWGKFSEWFVWVSDAYVRAFINYTVQYIIILIIIIIIKCSIINKPKLTKGQTNRKKGKKEITKQQNCKFLYEDQVPLSIKSSSMKQQLVFTHWYYATGSLPSFIVPWKVNLKMHICTCVDICMHCCSLLHILLLSHCQ